MKQKYHVYISYHRRDSEIALKVKRILQLALYTTWMDIDPLDMPLTECQKEALSDAGNGCPPAWKKYPEAQKEVPGCH